MAIKKTFFGYDRKEVDETMETLTTQNESLSRQNTYLEEEMKLLQKKLEDTEALVAAGMTQVNYDNYESLKKAYSALQENVKDMQEENRHLSERFSANQAEIDRLRSALSAAQAEKEQLSSNLAAAKAEKEQLSSDLAAAKNENSLLSEKVSEQQQAGTEKVQAGGSGLFQYLMDSVCRSIAESEEQVRGKMLENVQDYSRRCQESGTALNEMLSKMVSLNKKIIDEYEANHQELLKEHGDIEAKLAELSGVAGNLGSENGKLADELKRMINNMTVDPQTVIFGEKK